MAVTNFNGQLNTNELFSAIYNMIISQEVFAENIKGTNGKLVDSARVDGSMYGDTKLYYATDILKSVDWEQDSNTALNLLATHRPPSPKCEAITIDTFRQIALTVDDYMTKRAWATESAFSQFNSVMQGWLTETKRVYDSTTYNAFVGTVKAEGIGQTISITLPTQALTGAENDVEYGENKEASNRLQAQTIAQKVADIIVELEDVSRDYNDYGFMRSYDKDNFKFVWNSAWVNKITKLDIPTIFNKDIMDKFAEYTLPAKYFGNVNGTDVTSTGAANSTIRSLIEQDVNVGSTTTHVFAGQLMPNSCTLVSSGEIVYPTYTEDSTVVLKMLHKKDLPYMSGFEVGTSFYNPKNLSTNHYLTFGHNTIKHLYNFPLITLKATVSE